MINLLPEDTKRDIQAARANVVLLRYNFLTLIAIAGLLLICIIFSIVLRANQSSAINQSSDNQNRAASYAATRKAADEYRANLSLAKTILGNSVSYTSTVFEITKLLPNGVIFDGLTLNATDFGKQTSFSAHAKSYADATRLKENFEKSSLFTNVYLQSITNSSTDSSASSSYPIAVTLSALLKKEAGQ